MDRAGIFEKTYHVLVDPSLGFLALPPRHRCLDVGLALNVGFDAQSCVGLFARQHHQTSMVCTIRLGDDPQPSFGRGVVLDKIQQGPAVLHHPVVRQVRRIGLCVGHRPLRHHDGTVFARFAVRRRHTTAGRKCFGPAQICVKEIGRGGQKLGEMSTTSPSRL